MINHCPKSNSRRITSATYARYNVKADVILRKLLRRRRVHRVKHADEVMLDIAGIFLGAFGRDRSVHESHQVAGAIGALPGKRRKKPKC